MYMRTAVAAALVAAASAFTAPVAVTQVILSLRAENLDAPRPLVRSDPQIMASFLLSAKSHAGAERLISGAVFLALQAKKSQNVVRRATRVLWLVGTAQGACSASGGT